MNARNVAVVIPAFNEESYLPEVIRCVSAAGWLSQIVVVDDGSSDDTQVVAESFAQYDPRLMVVHLEENLGKGGALLAGVENLGETVDYVIFVDADLLGIQPLHLETILEPVRSGTCDMTVAVFSHGKVHTDIAQHVNPLLNGQRCLRRDQAIPALSTLEDSRYGVEVGLEIYAKQRHWRVERIDWEGVWQVVKEEKLGLGDGLRARGQMWSEIMKTLVRQGMNKEG
jgi:glycosyltransferase involved in cell wall biosynthesis